MFYILLFFYSIYWFSIEFIDLLLILYEILLIFYQIYWFSIKFYCLPDPQVPRSISSDFLPPDLNRLSSFGIGFK